MTPTTELGVHTGQINYMRREHFRRFSVWTTETQGEGSSREETLDRRSRVKPHVPALLRPTIAKGLLALLVRLVNRDLACERFAPYTRVGWAVSVRLNRHSLFDGTPTAEE
jgi:hypothetical protein